MPNCEVNDVTLILIRRAGVHADFECPSQTRVCQRMGHRLHRKDAWVEVDAIVDKL